MNSIHFICHSDNRGNLKKLTQITGRPGFFRSCCWAVSQEEARALVGGWVYLHPKKSDRSEFGGRVQEINAAIRERSVRELGFEFVLEVCPAARNQKWRGKSHGRAWTGGVVQADFPHELEAHDVKGT